MQKTDLVRESTSSPAAVTTYKLTTRVKLCSGRMPYVCTSLSLLTLGSSGSPVLIFCTTTAWHASIPGGSDALSSYTIRGGRLGSGINLKDRVGGGRCFRSSTDKRREESVFLTANLSHFTYSPNHLTPSALNLFIYYSPS